MVPYGERRHRINSLELPWVVEAIENQLREYLAERNPLNLHGAEQLFRLWYRIQIHREGRPGYPEFTWSSLEERLEAKGVICGRWLG